MMLDGGWPETVDLDELDFSPILARVEALLPHARRLAEWADDGEIGDWVIDEMTGVPAEDELTGELYRVGDFGETGATFLQRVFENWEAVQWALFESNLWRCPAVWEGSDRCRHEAARCLVDLSDQLFHNAKLVINYDLDGNPPPPDPDWYYVLLGPGTRLSLPHALFVRRLCLAAEQLREIVAGQKSKRPRMVMKEADDRARMPTATPEKKARFFALSKRKQAERIGCSFQTWSKTATYQDAVERGWLPKRKKETGESVKAPPRVVSMTPDLEATLGRGDRDEIVNQLAAEEVSEAGKPEWDDLPPSERQALLADHEADVASELTSPTRRAGSSRPRTGH
jgi:hypothetical protein